MFVFTRAVSGYLSRVRHTGLNGGLYNHVGVSLFGPVSNLAAEQLPLQRIVTEDDVQDGKEDGASEMKSTCPSNQYAQQALERVRKHTSSGGGNITFSCSGNLSLCSQFFFSGVLFCFGVFFLNSYFRVSSQEWEKNLHLFGIQILSFCWAKPTGIGHTVEFHTGRRHGKNLSLHSELENEKKPHLNASESIVLCSLERGIQKSCY